MDTAVALVQAYLHVNGYFTVAEYPVLEAQCADHQIRTVTDLDILAYRFPGCRARPGRSRRPPPGRGQHWCSGSGSRIPGRGGGHDRR